MRIVTRPDFDGVVCAVLLYEAESIKEPVKWLEPGEIQKGTADIQSGDILANLPYDDRCSLWFDHHYSNRIDRPFKGAFKITSSAARIIFEYYEDRFQRDYSELVKETDKIDSADFARNEVLHPEKYPYFLLSMTISKRDDSDEPYWNKLVELLRKFEIGTIHSDPEVKDRCTRTIAENIRYEGILKKHTRMKGQVSITDFRDLEETPYGNRFLVYSLFPESYVNVCILYDAVNREKVLVKVGHSIFNINCHVNVGKMLSAFDGGGHRGAGSCGLNPANADESIKTIVDILVTNET